MDHSSLNHLSPSDRAAFFSFGFGPAPIPTQLPCIHQAFTSWATLTPDGIAVEHGTAKITYRDLDLRSNHLAAVLRNNGVRPGKRVCIVASRGIALITGILATIKAGGQYVPLDGGIVTDDTLGYVLHDSEAIIALVTHAWEQRIPESFTFPRVVIEHVASQVEMAVDREERSPVEIAGGVEDLSKPTDGYVIRFSISFGAFSPLCHRLKR